MANVLTRDRVLERIDYIINGGIPRNQIETLRFLIGGERFIAIENDAFQDLIDGQDGRGIIIFPN